jgi:hypothetical protein
MNYGIKGISEGLSNTNIIWYGNRAWRQYVIRQPTKARTTPPYVNIWRSSSCFCWLTYHIIGVHIAQSLFFCLTFCRRCFQVLCFFLSPLCVFRTTTSTYPLLLTITVLHFYSWWWLYQKLTWWWLYQKRTWWWLYQKRVVHTKLDIFVFIP